MLIAVGNEVRRYSLDTKLIEYDDVVVTGRRIASLDVDTKHRLVYWTDTSDKAIRRATISADNRHPPIIQTLRTGRTLVVPSGIALDWIAKYSNFSCCFY